MVGLKAVFHLDLMPLSCGFQARGAASEIVISATIGGLLVDVRLSSENSPEITRGATGERRCFYNKIAISINKENEELLGDKLAEGRAHELLAEFQDVVVEIINRLVSYFKHYRRQPNLRRISRFDLLGQEQAFYNPSWASIDGRPLALSGKSTNAGIRSVPYVGWLFQGDSFGATPFDSHLTDELHAVFSSGSSEVPLSAQLLSDAQGAALSNNLRRAVLELAISVEIFVKAAFFKQDRTAGAAFDYLEDKGREALKVTELLDGVALYAFGVSFKVSAPNEFRQIDYLFRCRNKIAHRGEAIYRDDRAVWVRPDSNQLQIWWTAVVLMISWLQEKVDSARPARVQ